MTRVRFTNDAHTDLDEIFDYVAKDSPLAAEALLLRLYEACQQLGVAALHYAVAFSLGSSELRRRSLGSYNIYFRVMNGDVEIVRVAHSARDATRFFPDN
jgi:plasmid stabilization system protein ParE